MQRRHCEQAGNRRELFIDAAIAQNQNVDLVFFDHAPGHQAQFFQRLDQAFLATRYTEQNRQHANFEPRHSEPAHSRKFLIGENGAGEFEASAVGGLRIKQIAFRSQPYIGRCNNLFADAIDRRIGNLRKQLFEVVEQQAWLVRQRCKRCVIAHRADRLHAIARHGRHQQSLILEGIAECDLPLQQRVVIRRRYFRHRRQILEVN